MTRDEHRDEARKILASVQREMNKIEPTPEVIAEHTLRIAIAQVHATLAGPDRADLVTADGWCACGRKPYQHRLSPRCGSRPMPPPANFGVHHTLCLHPDKHTADSPCPVPSDGPGQ
jgi:hypothetical protein